VKIGDTKTAKKGQAVGEYCGGKDIEECRQYFGAGLPQICMKCPE
jgi:hypothetical protein